MAKRDTKQILGIIICFSLTEPVFLQTQCHYTILDPQQPTGSYSGQKTCYNGCCSTSSVDPCCRTNLDDNSLEPGAIGGIIIGVLVFLILIGAGIFIYLRRSKMKDDKGGEAYVSKQKPTVAYVANSEFSDTTDYKRENLGYATSFSTQARSRDTSLNYLPPIARQEDDSDLETASNRISYKSEPFSTKSEPQNYARHHSKNRNYADSVSSTDSRYDKRSVTSDPMPESRGRRPRDLPIRDQSPRGPRNRQQRDQSPYDRKPRDQSPYGRERDHSPYGRIQQDHSPHERGTRDQSLNGRQSRDQSPRRPRLNNRQPTTSTSSVESRDNRSRQGHHRPHHRNNPHSTSSIASREHSKSVSESMASDAGSIGTTV